MVFGENQGSICEICLAMGSSAKARVSLRRKHQLGFGRGILSPKGEGLGRDCAPFQAENILI